MHAVQNQKKKEINASKIYSPFGNLAEWAKKYHINGPRPGASIPMGQGGHVPPIFMK